MITVQLQTDFDNYPSGEVLATATTPVVDGERYWAGSDFGTAVAVVPDQVYWIIYQPMPFSPVGIAIEGDLHFDYWSSDGIHWVSPYEEAWKVKFWGEPGVVATEQQTWSAVKALFQ